MKKPQKGFAALEALLVVIILALVGGTGYYVYHSKQQTDKTLNSAQAEGASSAKQSSGAKAADKVSLASGRVTLSLPSGWKSDSTGASDCRTIVISDITSCLDGATLGITSLGPASDFSATVSVFDLGNGPTDPEQWYVKYQGEQAGSNPVQSGDVSTDYSVNGYKGWYYEQNVTASDYGPAYQDENYILVAANKVVAIYSRVKDDNGAPAAPVNFDFTKYLPDLKSLANSVEVN